MIQIFWLLFIVFQLIKHNEKDIDIIFFSLEYIITFPSSLLIGVTNYLYSFIYSPENYFINVPYRVIYLFINWIFFVIVGYFQWFILLPKIYISLKKL
jgi:hypothetical protein